MSRSLLLLCWLLCCPVAAFASTLTRSDVPATNNAAAAAKSDTPASKSLLLPDSDAPPVVNTPLPPVVEPEPLENTDVRYLLREKLADQNRAWSYDSDEKGEHNWASLNPEWQICEVGLQQSPINIDPELTVPAKEKPPVFSYPALARGEIFHMPQLLSLHVSSEATVHYRGTVYRLDHIDIHSPSEHTIGDEPTGLELQFVHKSTSGKWLIVAVMMEDSTHRHDGLQPILEAIPRELTGKKGVPVQFALSALLPDTLGYYAYTGSLSAPPCTEGVEWLVMRLRPTFGRDQLRAITAIVGRNSRNTQSTAGRIIRASH